ncbi:MAG: hypothetical protein A2940_01525 [Candidatus Wildermuthbacteria bacterium RIFCSPLOWO2_01_FULL_48_29]|uniref:F5/8 type C domain-containing protein n=2 Tax=Candidatus Wildermuthiibacteriota TaxID=1817923 RepID=A0A1G2RLI4_9BACT|nr:MAG: hypothetical protein A2843_01815 [Candidatus Wildermuthbacteria bacterium RIFCSPHIGHO2_01_FULL_48_27b]OHA73710.1 MAG: hypothetical protein A2940_01525 [Candidatus Wildermuthbacteria bacterium RIFCSPLOWO2_01_FULL_48_29]
MRINHSVGVFIGVFTALTLVLGLAFSILHSSSSSAQANFPGWSQINTIFYTSGPNNNQIPLDVVKELKTYLEPVAGKTFLTKNLGSNVALGKTGISSSVPPQSGWPAQLPAITDGDAILYGTSSNYVPIGSGLQWVRIDLGELFSVSKVNVRHYYLGDRTYKDVVVQLSEDGSAWTNIFNNDADNSAGQGAGKDAEYVDSSAGKDVVLGSPVQARYVRAWSNGSNASGDNFYVEIEVYGTYVAPPAQTNSIFLTIDPSNIELVSKKAEAFKIYTDPNGVHIIGKNAFGVRNGAYYLLEKLGFRWFFIHPAWNVSPTSLVPLDLNEIQEPSFLDRTIGAGLSAGALGLVPNGETDYANWLKRNKMAPDSIYKVHHSWPDFAQKDAVKAQDPSAVCYKADGVTPQQVFPDHSVVITRALNYARSYFAEPLERNLYTGDWQTRQVVSISPPDGNQIWCNEWLVDPGDYDPQIVTNKAFGLTNEVAKMLQTEYPGKYAGIMSYSWYPLSPSYTIAPNIYANVTTFTRGTALTPAQRLVAMKGKGVLTGFYDYFDVWAWWKDRIEPAGKYQTYFNALEEAATYANILEVEGSDNWGPKGRLYWTVSQYAWNSKKDFDALLDDFYTKAFGSAKEPMKRYYTRFDTQWLDEYSDSPDNNRVMGLAFRDLDEAMRLASGDLKVQERIRHVLYHTYFWWKWGDTVSGTYSDADGYVDFANANDAKEMYKFLWRIRDLHIVHFQKQEPAVRMALQNKYRVPSAAINSLQNSTPPNTGEAAAWLAAGVANWAGQDLIESSLIDASTLNLAAANANTPSALEKTYYSQVSARYEGWDATNIIVPSTGNETIPLELLLLVNGPGGAGPVTLEWVSPTGSVLAQRILSYSESGIYPTPHRTVTWNVSTTVAGRYTLRSTTHNGWAVNIARGAAHDISKDGEVSAARQGYFYVPAETPALIVGLTGGTLTLISPGGVSYVITSGERGFKNPQSGFWKIDIPAEINAAKNAIKKKVWILGVAPLLWHDPKYLLAPASSLPPTPTPTPILRAPSLTSISQLSLYADKTSQTVTINGNNFTADTYKLRIFQNGILKATVDFQRQSETVMQGTITPTDIGPLTPGFYDIKLNRISDNSLVAFSRQILITKLGDLWSLTATTASEIKGDGKIDIYDISRLFSKWNSVRAEDLAEADINPGPANISLGKIDIYDVNKMMANWSR